MRPRFKASCRYSEHRQLPIFPHGRYCRLERTCANPCDVFDLLVLACADGLFGFELGRLRSQRGSSFKLIVPGIRPAGAEKYDQKRIMTPAQAMHAGADFLVVGRPITQAVNRSYAAREISMEVEAALDGHE